jgi:hypothetical protein
MLALVAGAFRLFGWHGDYRLYGETRRDQLRGQGGNDVVIGGPQFDFCSLEVVRKTCEAEIS